MKKGDLSKGDIIQISKLMFEHYLYNTLDDINESNIKKYVPPDCVFDDGRVEYILKNFKYDRTNNTENNTIH